MTEDITHLKDIVTRTLATSGILGQFKAQLRATVFDIIHGEDRGEIFLENKELKKVRNDEEFTVMCWLISNFLEKYNLNNSKSIFLTEVSLNQNEQLNSFSEKTIVEKLGIHGPTLDDDSDKPLLWKLMKCIQGLKNDTSYLREGQTSETNQIDMTHETRQWNETKQQTQTNQRNLKDQTSEPNNVQTTSSSLDPHNQFVQRIVSDNDTPFTNPLKTQKQSLLGSLPTLSKLGNDHSINTTTDSLRNQDDNIDVPRSTMEDDETNEETMHKDEAQASYMSWSRSRDQSTFDETNEDVYYSDEPNPFQEEPQDSLGDIGETSHTYDTSTISDSLYDFKSSAPSQPTGTNPLLEDTDNIQKETTSNDQYNQSLNNSQEELNIGNETKDKVDHSNQSQSIEDNSLEQSSNSNGLANHADDELHVDDDDEGRFRGDDEYDDFDNLDDLNEDWMNEDYDLQDQNNFEDRFTGTSGSGKFNVEDISVSEEGSFDDMIDLEDNF